jgi:hypothetical protein
MTGLVIGNSPSGYGCFSWMGQQMIEYLNNPYSSSSATISTDELNLTKKYPYLTSIDNPEVILHTFRKHSTTYYEGMDIEEDYPSTLIDTTIRTPLKKKISIKGKIGKKEKMILNRIDRSTIIP